MPEDADFYVCGPGPFMDTVRVHAVAAGAPADRVHLERFDVADVRGSPPDAGAAVTEEVTIVLDGAPPTAPYCQGDTLLQTARMAGLRAPSSCETGSAERVWRG